MYDDNDKGVLFKNDQKGNDKAPAYKGKINVRGEEFYLAAWLNTSSKGTRYMSLKVSEIIDSAGQAKKPAQKPAQVDTNEFVDDDVPF